MHALLYRLTVLILITTLFTRCQIDNLEDPIIVPVVEQEFVLDLWQPLSEVGGNQLVLHMYTIENEPCLNTEILSGQDRVGRTAKLFLYDILEPEVCDPGEAPATGTELLTELTPDLYRLEIDLQSVIINKGWLTVNEAAFQIEMDEENGIQWRNYELRRVPADALWGYITYRNEEEKIAAQQLMDQLTEESNPHALADGYYGHFTLRNVGAEVEPLDAPTGEQLSFLVRSQADRQAIENLVTDFRAAAESEVEVRIMDGQGHVWPE